MRRIWRLWPWWVGYAAGGFAALVVVLGVAGGEVSGWAGAVGGALGLAGLVLRRSWVVWAGAVVLAFSTFGLLQDLVTLLGHGRPDSWPAFLAKAARVVAILLLMGSALVLRRRALGVCGRCGYEHADGAPVPLGFPEASTASGRVRWVAYAGAASFLPYAAAKVVFGLENGAVLAEHGGLMAELALFGVDLTALLAVLGIFLLVAMTRPWSQVWPRWVPGLAGRRVPRWLPLVPAWLGATLGPYGLLGVGYLLVFGTDGLPGYVAQAGIVGFTGVGSAFAVVAWDYQRRTRPRCLTGDGAAVPAR
ncbi:hypothetical protein ACFWYW_35455 [Nonomuraea sp. NPDC059023]|uniref:hypothetical protein n=1 Tax=unclassified Nonomuraea TaxID=2593643 RepID=UPI0036C15998